MQFTTAAVVIKEVKIEQHDKLLTLLTQDRGVITVYARGAGKIRSGMVSSTELLCYSNFYIYTNKEKYYLNNAESITVFFDIRGDLQKLSLATYFCQISDEFVQPFEVDDSFMRLLLNSLHFLQQGNMPQSVLKSIYELRSLTMAGYMPDLVACTGCGGCDSKLYFCPNGGVMFCSNCKPATNTAVIPLNAGVLSAMRHIIYSDFNKLFNFTIQEQSQKELAKITKTYMICQAEKILPALNYYESICNFGRNI